MLLGKALERYKKKLIHILGNYCEIEPREDQLVVDMQLQVGSDVRPEDVRQALQSLMEDGYATRRILPLRGAVWKITAEGLKTLASLSPEDIDG
jgi:hypothetical protein